MATYAIGDVQGCFDELKALLKKCGYDKKNDRLWFVGDLVNRGPKSLEVLRFVRGLGARDAKQLVDWLRTRPMMHAADGYAMVHAGLLPVWSVKKALALAKEVETALGAADYREFLKNMYGSKPEEWSDSLQGWDRLRVIVNAMTRMRFCSGKGRMEFHAKGAKAPPGYLPWYETRTAKETPLVFGHWSQLGLRLDARATCLDSGCVWGSSLSALRLEDRALYQVACRGYQAPGGE
jgi:bis(5'-nucleosyl)-tetraphosphatase (symmetrical)